MLFTTSSRLYTKWVDLTRLPNKIKRDEFRGNLRDTIAKRQQTTRRHKKQQEQLQQNIQTEKASVMSCNR